MWINANETLYLLYSPILSTHYGASNWLDTSTDPNPVYHHFHTKKSEQATYRGDDESETNLRNWLLKMIHSSWQCPESWRIA